MPRFRIRVTRPGRGDLIAGITVALVLVPQSLAYATLAGLPPVHGLYAAAAAPLAAAMIGSSPYLQTGPTALISLLTLSAVGPLATTGTGDFAAHAALLSLVVGAVRLLIGLLRWGALAFLMSQPVVSAFTTAAATLIVASQVPDLLGTSADDDNPFVGAARAVVEPGGWQLVALAVGLGTIALVAAGRRLHPLFPGVLVATAAGLVLTSTGAVSVPEVGSIPSGLPTLSLDLPWSSLPNLLLPGVVIALVGFAEPAAIARRYASADRTPWHPDREFIGQGVGSLACGLFGGYAAGGSFSRTALNRLSGARTRWSGAVTGATVLCLLPFGGVLSQLPTAVLAGLVIIAAISLIELAPFTESWRISRPQFAVAAVTVVVTLAAAPRVEWGIVAGVGLSLAVHLWREMRLELTASLHDTELHAWLTGVLYFGSAPSLETRLRALLTDHPDAQRLVLHLDGVGRLDMTGMFVLRGVMDDGQASGVEVVFRGIPPQARERAVRVLGDAVEANGEASTP